MANKPAPIVFKTKKPTAAQKALMLEQRFIDKGVAYDAAVRSGRILGAPADIGSMINNQAVAGTNGKPIVVDKNGFVVNPAGDTIAALKPRRQPRPLPRKPATVKINRDGTITATAHGKTTTGRPGPLGHAAAGAETGALPATQGMPNLPAPERNLRGRNTAARTPASAGGTNGGTTPAGAPMSDFDLARTRAGLLLDPVVKQVTDLLNARINAEQNAVTGYSGELARLFGLYSGTAGKAFDSGIASTAAVNDALANRLAGVTTAAGNDLAAKLAAINADPGTAARISSDLAAAGKGAGNAGFALGSADLSTMLGRKANAQEYGAKLPGLAGLYGLNDTRAVQQRGTQDLASALTDIQGNAPSLVSSLLSQIQNYRSQQAQLQFERDQFGVKTKAASAAAAAEAADKAYQRRKDQASFDIQVRKLGLSEARLKRQLAKDERDLRIKGALRGLSPQKYQEFQAKAAGAAREYHQRWTDANGKENDPLPWLQYIRAGLRVGIPQWVLIQEGRKVYTQPEIRQGLIPGRGR